MAVVDRYGKKIYGDSWNERLLYQIPLKNNTANHFKIEITLLDYYKHYHKYIIHNVFKRVDDEITQIDTSDILSFGEMKNITIHCDQVKHCLELSLSTDDKEMVCIINIVKKSVNLQYY